MVWVKWEMLCKDKDNESLKLKILSCLIVPR